ncbi:MAG: hypothetical protein E6507_06085 [Prevotella bivia]|nr:hypothetical protein [Prevotella bivia]
MNTKDKNINNAAGSRRTYLSPRTEILKMEITNLLDETLAIPRTDENTDEAYAKPFPGDVNSLGEETDNY